ncbi:MAG: TlpA disulfide reductase family protein [Novosphingobium sp.]
MPLLSSRSFKLVGLACVAPAALVLGGCDRQSNAPAQPEASAGAKPLTGTLDLSHKGTPLPAFTVRDPSGKTLNLASLKGKPALVNLWATWCAPCIAELPTLDRLAAEGLGKFRVVTISQDMQTAKVADFLKTNGDIVIEPWLDPETELSFRYGASTLPTTILYDAAGKEVWRFVGGRDWMAPETAKLLEQGGIGVGGEHERGP